MQGNNILSERLKTLENVLDISPGDMAKIGGCSLSTYYRYRNGESVPDFKFLNKILKNENKINIEWLIEGEGAVLKRDEVKEKQLDKIKFVTLPLYSMEPQGETGEGSLNVDEWKSPSKTLPLCNFFLRSIVNAEPDKLFALRVNCDSMSPTIKRESMVLVDQGKTSPAIDGIFVVRIDDLVRMKLVQRMPANRLQLSTINDNYKPIEIDLNDKENFKIMGRITWIGTPA